MLNCHLYVLVLFLYMYGIEMTIYCDATPESVCLTTDVPTSVPDQTIGASQSLECTAGYAATGPAYTTSATCSASALTPDSSGTWTCVATCDGTATATATV